MPLLPGIHPPLERRLPPPRDSRQSRHMASAALSDIVQYCNRRLRPDAFTDYEGAVNGLQFENRGHVSKLPPPWMRP